MQDPGAQGAIDSLQTGQCFLAAFSLNVDHNIANLRCGLQILTCDVDLFISKELVDLVQDPRLVTMNVQQAAGVVMLRQRNLREVDC